MPEAQGSCISIPGAGEEVLQSGSGQTEPELPCSPPLFSAVRLAAPGSPIHGRGNMQWPIDTSEFSFMGSLPPEPVLDHWTRQQKTGLTGEPLYCMEPM
jgi:hypothetical protein